MYTCNGEKQLINELSKKGYKYKDGYEIGKIKYLDPIEVEFILKWLPEISRQHIGAGIFLAQSVRFAKETFDPAPLIKMFKDKSINQYIRSSIGFGIILSKTGDISRWLKRQLLQKDSTYEKNSLVTGLSKRGGFKSTDELKGFLEQIFTKYPIGVLEHYNKIGNKNDIDFLLEQMITADSQVKREIEKTMRKILKREGIIKKQTRNSRVRAIPWFRNKSWDARISADFEAHLKRARGTFGKAQYLKIQGLELLDTENRKTQEIGVRLLLRTISEYPMEEMEVMESHEALGNYYFVRGNFENAEGHLRIVVGCYKKTRNGTTWMADLTLAETILKSKQLDKFNEAYKYVVKFPVEELGFNSQRFYHSELAALLCWTMNKKAEAKKYALKALEYSRILKPEFARHKNLGLVQATDDQIKRLNEIAK